MASASIKGKKGNVGAAGGAPKVGPKVRPTKAAGSMNAAKDVASKSKFLSWWRSRPAPLRWGAYGIAGLIGLGAIRNSTANRNNPPYGY